MRPFQKVTQSFYKKMTSLQNFTRSKVVAIIPTNFAQPTSASPSTMRQSLVLASIAALAAISIMSSANAEMNPEGMMKMAGGIAINVLEGCIKGDPCEIFNKKCLTFILGKTRDFTKGKMPEIMSLMSDAKTEGCESLIKIIMNSFMG